MAIPAIKAIRQITGVTRLDLLIGDLPDDFGAFQVLQPLIHQGVVDTIHQSPPGDSEEYDVAVLSIPYDGRWRNGIHFRSKVVLDGRTRPDPSTTGLISWKMHEIEYQMENAYNLGYRGEIPSTQFFDHKIVQFPTTTVYLGVGYKKDAANFWSQKHWGNENYVRLIKTISEQYQVLQFIMTGDDLDFQINISKIIKECRGLRVEYLRGNLPFSIDALSGCHLYVGNDTGMMHVAASMGIPTVPIFFLENSITKSYPWGQKENVIDGVGRKVSPEEVWQKICSVKGWK